MIEKLIAVLAVAVLSLPLVGCSTPKPADNGYYRQKVVYHIDDINHAYGALRNINNHLNALGDENADIVVVTHGSGALMLVEGSTDKKGHHFEETVQALANRGVKFDICANTIRSKKIPENKIDFNAHVVPSGVAEIIDLEQKGYYYIKP